MTKERAEHVVSALWVLIDLVSKQNYVDGRMYRDHLAALLADEPEPEKPPEAVYRTAEELAEAFADATSYPRRMETWAYLRDRALACIRRYKPEAK